MAKRTLFVADDGPNGPALWITDGTPGGTRLLKDIAPGLISPAIASFTDLGNGKVVFAANGPTGAPWVTDGTPEGTIPLADTSPANFIRFGNKIAFNGYNAATGVELWVTDGTPAGTFLIKDIAPGADSPGFDAPFTALGDKLVFVVDDGVNGGEPWVTDGTLAGTMLLRDINLGGSGSGPTNLVRFGDKIVFSAYDGSDSELWITDGTPAGTILLKNISATVGSEPRDFTVFGDKLIFRAFDSATGNELYVTDGTTAGTVLLKDIDVGTGSSSPEFFTRFGNLLAFAATSADNGRELWVTDGTAGGTIRISDIVSGPDSGDPLALFALGNKLLFTASTAAAGRELWVTDGTLAGTQLLEVAPGTQNAIIQNMTIVGNRAVFTAYSDATTEFEPWVTDGTPAGTMLLKNINPAAGVSSFSQNFTRLGDKALFTANDGVNGPDLWITDGTPAGTMLVDVPDVRTAGANPANLVAFGSKLFYAATTPIAGSEAWVTDGTVAGSFALGDINPGTAGSAIVSPIVAGRTIFFSANTTTSGYELWKSDGTAGGAVQVAEIQAATANGVGNLGIALGGKVLFSANDGTGTEPWVSDGTLAGTVKLLDIASAIGGSSPSLFTPFGTDKAVFVATASATGQELYITDGTPGGTSLLKDINPNAAGSGAQQFTMVGTQMAFRATTANEGAELWFTDGTSVGTRLVANINPSSTGSTPANLTAFGDKLVFSANDGTNGVEPWISDGTTANTFMLANLNPGSASSAPASFNVLGDKVVFVANSGTTGANPFGAELWVTTGLAGGTTLVKDINPGTGTSNPQQFARIGTDKLVFRATTANEGTELWVTDGTPGGTTMLKDIYTGPIGSSPNLITSIGAKAIFSAANNTEGTELWVTDGTVAGTFILKDIIPGFTGTVIASITRVGDKAYFVASDSYRGNEVWVTDGTVAGTMIATDTNATKLGSAPATLFTFDTVEANVAPVVTASAGTTAFVEGAATSTPVAIDAGVTLTDDGATLASATVAITAGFSGSEDVLGFSGTAATGNITGAYDALTGVLTLTSAGAIATVAQFQAALRVVTYVDSSQNPNAATRTISFTVNDGALASAAATRAVSVAATNDAPGGTDGSITIAEDTPRALTVADFGFDDHAASTQSEGQALLAIKIASTPASGTLTYDADGAGAGLPVGVAVGQDITAADIAAGKLVFTPAANFTGAPYTSFAFQVQDNGGTDNGGVDLDASPNTLTINVTPVNDAPTSTGYDTITFTEGDGSMLLDTGSNQILTDVDSSNFDGGTLTVRVTGNKVATEDSLVIITGSGHGLSASNGVLSYMSIPIATFTPGGPGVDRVITFNANASLTPVQTVMRYIGYLNTNTNNPSAAQRTIEYTLTDGDGGTLVLTSLVNVVPVNDAPTSTGFDTITYVEGAAATLLDTGFNQVLTDVDSANFDGGSLTVRVTGNKAATEDTLTFFTGGGSFLSINNGVLSYMNVPFATFAPGGAGVDRVFTFNADATVAAVQTLMRNLAYLNSNTATPSTAQRTIEYTLTDGDGGTLSLTSLVNVTANNDAPVGIDATIAIPTHYTLRVGNFGFTDVEGNALLAVKIATLPTAGTLYYDANGALGGQRAAVTAGQTITVADVAAGKLTYVANGSGTGYASLTFQVQDNGGVANGGIDLDASPNTLTFDVTASATVKATFGAVIDLLTDLSATNGFRVAGGVLNDNSGQSVAAIGDFNSDGYGDFIDGARAFDPAGRSNAGAAFIIFGKAGAFGPTAIGSLGSAGVTIQGEALGDLFGYSAASAGDFNGDGYADVVIGARVADPNGRIDAGAAYIVFGRASGPSVIDTATLGPFGIKIQGAATQDQLGWSASTAGDINRDGYGDIIVSAHLADAPGRADAGISYVIFGKASSFSTIDLSSPIFTMGPEGFAIRGEAGTDQSGFSVSTAGDINADGYADIIIGANNNDPLARSNGGAAYVVFGKASGFGTIDLGSLGTSGFKIQGEATNNRLGASVSGAGDVNGDGFADIIVGAPGNAAAGRIGAGAAYVIFGKASGFGTIDTTTLGSTDGFKILGAAASQATGTAVSSAGDVNGDGYADLLVAAPSLSLPGRSFAGGVYVLFGKAGGFATVDLATLANRDGFKIHGEAVSDGLGNAVSSAGDINSDGYDDLIVASYLADPGGIGAAGSAYVIFGRPNINTAPTGTTATVTMLEDGARTLTATDFGFGDIDGHAFAAVRIATLPTAGTLTLGGVAVNANQLVAVADLPTLVFTPAANGNGAGYASFTFQVQDDAGTANGGIDLDQSANTLTVAVTAVNDAPVLTGPTAAMVPEGLGGSATTLFAGLVLSDIDASDYPVGGALTLTAARAGDTLALFAKSDFTVADGTISHAPQGAIGTITGLGTGTVTVTFSGAATLALAGELARSFALTIGDVGVISHAVTLTYTDNGAAPLQANATQTVTIDYVYQQIEIGQTSATGTARVDFIVGRETGDTLAGLGGDDRLYGQDGVDTLMGGAGADILYGGDGRDVASYRDNTGAVLIDLAAHTVAETGLTAGTVTPATAVVTTDLVFEVEGAVGSAYGDRFYGTAGADSFAPGAGADIAYGLGGTDVIDYSGAAGALFFDMPANTVLETGLTTGTVNGLTAVVGTDLVFDFTNAIGSAFGDRYYGTAAANSFAPGAGNDIAYGGGGSDTIDYSGAAGALFVDMPANTVLETALTTGTVNGLTAVVGTDLVFDFMNAIGSAFGDRMYGTTGVNRLDGGGGADVLYGGDGNDVLIGGDGADKLIGENGADTLTGGAGADAFYFVGGESGGADTVTDFAVGIDKLLFKATSFGGSIGGTAMLVSGTNPQAVAPNTFLYDSGTGVLSFDADGAGGAAAVAIASIGAGLALTSGDLVFF